MQNEPSSADDPFVAAAIQAALANESKTGLYLHGHVDDDNDPRPLTAHDARIIVDSLRATTRIEDLTIWHFLLQDDAALNVFRDGLPLCTSLTSLNLFDTRLGNEELEILLPAFYNTSITSLNLSITPLGLGFRNNIHGPRGGAVLCNLLAGNNNMVSLNLSCNLIGPECTLGMKQGLFYDNAARLQKLNLYCCHIGINGLANLLALPAGDGACMIKNNTLTDINLGDNSIAGAEGGRLVCLLLQRFPALNVLVLGRNNLGPLGARALAPGLAAASRLQELDLCNCGLGNVDVSNLVPSGQVNRSLTRLDLRDNHEIQGDVGGENVVALASRCANLDRLDVSRGVLTMDQLHCLYLLMCRKRLCTAAQALAGSEFSDLFQFVQEEAHGHEHGLSAIYIILQNDGDDHFYKAFLHGR
jgi:Leucine Rich repeat